MSDAYRLTLPLPPSINHYWRRVGPRTILSAEARRYREAATLAARLHRIEPIQGDVDVVATIYMQRRGSDLDNRIKPLLDALNGIAWADDRQVRRLDLTRDLDPGNPRVEMTLRPAPSDAPASAPSPKPVPRRRPATG